MAKEGNEESGNTQEGGVHLFYKEMIEQAVQMACNQEGGLELTVSWRRWNEVRETVTFGPGTKVEARVNPQNYDVTLILNGIRYLTRESAGNQKLIMMAANFDSGSKFRFRNDLTFRTFAEQVGVMA